MPSDAIDQREQWEVIQHVRMTLVDFDWTVRRIKHTRPSAYVYAQKAKKKIVVRISDHPPSLSRRRVDLSIHPDGGRTIDLIAMLCQIEQRFLQKQKRRPRDQSLDGGQDRSRGRRLRRMHFGQTVVKQRLLA